MKALAKLIHNPEFIAIKAAYQLAVDEHAHRSEKWPDHDDHGPEKIASRNELLRHQMAFGNFMDRAGVSTGAISEALQAVKPQSVCHACSQELVIARLEAEKAELTKSCTEAFHSLGVHLGIITGLRTEKAELEKAVKEVWGLLDHSLDSYRACLSEDVALTVGAVEEKARRSADVRCPKCGNDSMIQLDDDQPWRCLTPRCKTDLGLCSDCGHALTNDGGKSDPYCVPCWNSE